MATSGNQTSSQQSRPDASKQTHETAQRIATGAVDIGNDAAQYYIKEPAKDLFALAKSYANEKPDVAACWAFGLGILVGWKLKP